LLTQLAGAYETPGGAKVHIAVAASGGLSLELPGQVIPLTHVKALSFRTRQFSDLILEFMLKDEQVTGLQQRDPSGELRFRKGRRQALRRQRGATAATSPSRILKCESSARAGR
jgi:hypothetical protein